MANTFIILPHSGGAAESGFWSDSLKNHLSTLDEKGMRMGANQAMLADIDENSLDYFLRTRYAHSPDVMQLVTSVKEALRATGDFVTRTVPQAARGRDPEWIFLKED